MEEIKFRNLRADEIQVRPTDTKTKGSATLLLYKDARVDMDILDETVKASRWQREYYEVKGVVYCRIGILTDNGWVWKSDCGIESNTDAAKGEASDAAKRAAVAWGIGRELYSGPKIRLTGLPDNYYYNDKLTMQFYVRDIQYDGKIITELVIADRFGNIVFNWSINDGRRDTAPAQPQAGDQVQVLKDFCSGMKGTEDNNELLKFYNFYEPKARNWKGEFQAERLWSSWKSKIRN